MQPVFQDRAAEGFEDFLVDRGTITPEQRDWGMAAARRAGTPIALVLISAGLVPRRRMYELLAEFSGVPYIDLAENPPDEGMLDGLDPEDLVREGWVPVRRLPGGRILVAGARRPWPETLTAIERVLGVPVDYHITTDWDIQGALARGLRDLI
ncbi:MAG: hypothetical protein J2P26_14785, partial [Nocardiopsaceae bacterium]|nr:hypothetical protein [Nocardiopsaceae bacterium]